MAFGAQLAVLQRRFDSSYNKLSEFEEHGYCRGHLSFRQWRISSVPSHYLVERQAEGDGVFSEHEWHLKYPWLAVIRFLAK